MIRSKDTKRALENFTEKKEKLTLSYGRSMTTISSGIKCLFLRVSW